jgi:hypothetical protein
MKPKLLAMCFTVACSVVLLNAQDPSQSRTTTQSETRTTTQERHETTSTEAGTGKKMTLTGCLETGSTPNTYVLNHVTVSHEGTAGMGKQPSEMPKAETSYTLTAASSVNLKDHVGHKVEVAGKTEKGKAQRGSTTESTEASFKVDSLKHVSATCP